MNLRVIVFGATGMVGEGVLHEALKDPVVESVLVIGRRSCGVSHPKLTEILHKDFFDYGPIRERLKGFHACFFCLGVTSVGKSEQEYRRLTYDLTMAAARTLVELNPGMVFCYVSGLGTDSTEQGRSMWARVKGKTENDLRKLPFRKMYAFRPGFIKPGAGLKHTHLFARILAPLFPILQWLFPNYVCTIEDVGRSMIRVATTDHPLDTLECADITRISREKQ